MACSKCGGAGWLWWDELDEYSGPGNETGQDDTKYSCDACDGPDDKHVGESFQKLISWLEAGIKRKQEELEDAIKRRDEWRNK